MLAKKLERLKSNERGQIIVLGVLAILLVALMMLLTLNIGQSVHEKIRIQQLADASAFSTATLEARAFNFFAYTNRANIGSLVSAASAHGYMSMASTVPMMFKTASMNFIMMGICEIGLCCACSYCSCVQHCIEAGKDFATAWKYWDRGDELEDNLRDDVDQAFVDVIDALDMHMKYIAIQQGEMRLWTQTQVGMDKVAKELIGEFSPGAEQYTMVAATLNAGLFDQVDGSRGFGSVFEDEEEKRKWLATEIANGTRWGEFVFSRSLISRASPYLFIHFQTLKELLWDIPRKYTNGFSAILWHEGESRIIKGASDSRNKIGRGSRGPDGDAAAGADETMPFGLFSYAFCCAFAGTYKARVASDKDSGEHKCWYGLGPFPIPSSCCDDESKHENFECLGTGSTMLHNCFTLFDPDDDPSHDFGQPVVYSVISQDLRRTKGEGGKMPWEVTETESGEISVDLGGDVGKKSMQISDRPEATPGGTQLGKGVAMSKALVYYHFPRYPDGWKEHPNFFNPYWKAKLQPYRGAMEATKVLGVAGLARKYAAALGLGILSPPPLP